MFCDNRIKFFLQFLNLTRRYLDVRGLSLCPTHRLVNHHTAVGQGRPLAFGSGHQQYGCHRRRHARANRSYGTADKLHRIINTQSGIYRTAGRIDIDGNILSRIHRIQIKQLSLQRIGRVIIYLGSQEYDTIHHQTGKHIHLCHVQLTLFQNIGIEILVLRAHYVVQHLAVQAQMLHCILSKIFHSQTIYAEKGNT